MLSNAGREPGDKETRSQKTEKNLREDGVVSVHAAEKSSWRTKKYLMGRGS